MQGTKIFNLSLHRSATESFSRFMAHHGLRAAHWPGMTFDLLCQQAAQHCDTTAVFGFARETIEANDVFADVPYCFLYRELLNAYPDAFYLIVLRPVSTWIESVRQHIDDRELHNMEKLQYGLYINTQHNYITDYTDLQLQEVYIRHIKSVVNLTRAYGAKFRLFELAPNSLEQNDLAAELAEYLCFEPSTPFPSINVSRQWLT